MKYIFLAFFSVLFISTAVPRQASALSVAYCEEDTVECKIQNCETDVLVNNWPSDTGYTRDCEAEFSDSGIDSNLGVGIAIAVIVVNAWLVFLFLIKGDRVKRFLSRRK